VGYVGLVGVGVIAVNPVSVINFVEELDALGADHKRVSVRVKGSQCFRTK